MILFFKPRTITPENLIEIKHHLIKIRSAKVKRCLHEPYWKLSSDPLILFLSVYLYSEYLHQENLCRPRADRVDHPGSRRSSDRRRGRGKDCCSCDLSSAYLCRT